MKNSFHSFNWNFLTSISTTCEAGGHGEQNQCDACPCDAYSLVGKTRQLNKLCQYKRKPLKKQSGESMIRMKRELGRRSSFLIFETSRMKSWPGQEGNIFQLRCKNSSYSRNWKDEWVSLSMSNIRDGAGEIGKNQVMKDLISYIV